MGGFTGGSGGQAFTPAQPPISLAGALFGQGLIINSSGEPVIASLPVIGSQSYLAEAAVSWNGSVFTASFSGVNGFGNLTAANWSHIATGQWRLDASSVAGTGLFVGWANVVSYNGSSGAATAGTQVSSVSGGKTMDFYTFHFAAGAWAASDLAALQLLIFWR